MNKFIKALVSMFIITVLLSGVGFAASSDYNELAESKFKDVKESDWFAEAIGKLNILKIVDGIPGGSFNPQGEVTRAQFAKMLVQAMEYEKVTGNSFKDMQPANGKPHWAADYIETALKEGIIIKSEMGEYFYPDKPLARLDMVMMMCRALKLEPSKEENPFTDLSVDNGYATRAFDEYLLTGVVENYKRHFKPDSGTSRAEASVIISRMIDYRANPEAYKAEEAKKDFVVKVLSSSGTAPTDFIEPEFIIDRNHRSYGGNMWFVVLLANYEKYKNIKHETNVVCISNKEYNRYETPNPSYKNFIVSDATDFWADTTRKSLQTNKGMFIHMPFDKYLYKELVHIQRGCTVRYIASFRKEGFLKKYQITVVAR